MLFALLPGCQAPRRSSIYTETHPHSDDIEMNSLADRDIDSISMPCPTVFTAPLGCVVIEFIDEGVGMAAEDCKQLFKSIVQFNPNELQV